MAEEISVIQKFYEGGKVFVTGGTGFVGNLLIQKLIRDCPGISTLYLLVRSKRGKSPEERLEEIFKDPVFDKMKSQVPNYADKIMLISGDMEKPMLGLSENDIRMLEQEVNIVFHVAATVRFDEKIKKAAVVNVKATKDLIQMVKNMPNLRVYMHISTAYSHCYLDEIGEELYDLPMDPDRLLEVTQQLDDEELEVLTPKWIAKWPNTYTYTKAMAEKIVEKYAQNLPVGIFRPSIIVSTVKEPVEGWVNNLYGPVGLTMGIGAGVIRVVYGNEGNTCELVPADFVVNSIIAAAQDVGTSFCKPIDNNVAFDELEHGNEIKIYNYISSNENRITWADYKWYGMNICIAYVPVNLIWYPFVLMIPSPFWFKVLTFLIHTVPAYIMDYGRIALGKKPMLVKICEKTNKFGDTLGYFATHQWKYRNDNVQALWRNLNTTDKRIFEFSMAGIKWRKYFVGFARGIRVFLYKDPLETVPQAQRKHKMLKFAHYTLVTILAFTPVYLLYKIALSIL